MWMAPFPPPRAVAEYEQLLPGTWDRLLRMAEQEQAADIASARDKEEYIQRQFRRGQLLGIFALLMTPKAGLSKADALILRVGEPGVGAVAPVFVPA
jgi:uncharacterized membrane protein